MNVYEGARRGDSNPMAIALQAEQQNVQLVREMAQQSEKEVAEMSRYQELMAKAFSEVSNMELPGPSKTRLIALEKAERAKVIEKLRSHGGDIRKFMAYGGSTVLADYASAIKNSQEWQDGMQSKTNQALIQKQIVEGGLIPHKVKVKDADGNMKEIFLEDAIAAYNGDDPNLKVDVLPFGGGFRGVDEQKLFDYVTKSADPWATVSDLMSGQDREVAPEQMEKILRDSGLPDWYVGDYVTNYRNKYYGKAQRDKTGRVQRVNPFVWAKDPRYIGMAQDIAHRRAMAEAAMEKAKATQDKGWTGTAIENFVVPEGQAEPTAWANVAPSTTPLNGQPYKEKTISEATEFDMGKSVGSVSVVYFKLGDQLIPVGDVSAHGQTDPLTGQPIRGMFENENEGVPYGTFQFSQIVGGQKNHIKTANGKQFVLANMTATGELRLAGEETNPSLYSTLSNGNYIRKAIKNGANSEDKTVPTQLFTVWVPWHIPEGTAKAEAANRSNHLLKQYLEGQ
jgi:hypothetical protein